jgi:cytoskeletal protein CcmA (bactofilin family)
MTMAKKDTVEKSDETLADRVAQLEATSNWLAAIVRKILKRSEQHWGVDLNGDGKVGSVRVAMLIVALFAGLVFAATTTIVDWGTGVSGTIGTAKIQSDGTSATLTVDKLSISGSQTFVGATTLNNLTVNTNAQVNGTLTAVTGLTSTGKVTAVGAASVGTSLTVSGVTTNIGAQVLVGATTANNITVNTNATIKGDLDLNYARVAAGTLTNGLTQQVADLPATCSNTNGVWIRIQNGGTNMVIKAYPY